jgi:tripeptidyl-peptidase-1
MGIFEEGNWFLQEDLDLFFANFTPRIPKGTQPTPAYIDGSEAPAELVGAGGESDLDFELAYPLIYPQTITLFQTDDLYYAEGAHHNYGFFNTFLDALDGVRKPQQVKIHKTEPENQSYCSYSAFGETGDDRSFVRSSNSRSS